MAAPVDPLLLLLPRVLRGWERRRRWRASRRLLAVIAIAVQLVFLLALLAAEHGLLRPDGLGWALYVLAALLLLWLVFMGIWTLLPWGVEMRAARRLDRLDTGPVALPVSGAMALVGSDDGAAWMRRRSAAQAIALVQARGDELLPSAAFWHLLSGGLITVLLLASVHVFDLQTTALRLVRPWDARSLAIRHEIVVDAPSVLRIGQGQSWQLRARCRPAPQRAGLELLGDDGRQRLVDLRVDGEQLRWEEPVVGEGFRYRILVERDRSMWHRVVVGLVPRLEELRRVLRPPEYTGLPARPWSDNAGSVLIGSTLELSAVYGKAVVDCWVQDDRGQRHPLQRRQGRW